MKNSLASIMFPKRVNDENRKRERNFVAEQIIYHRSITTHLSNLQRSLTLMARLDGIYHTFYSYKKQ